jgi:antibiotic biosynthesis monooxygenase (ABM) superfamily enzyme
MQVALPPAVRAWVPHRIGFATAVYTNGLLIGEILPVALMFPLVLLTLMTFVVMPAVTRVLHRWLGPRQDE